MARRHRRRRRGRRIQRLFFNAAAHAAVAGRCRHVCARFAMGGTHPVWLRRSDRRLGRLRCRRLDPHSGFATHAHAICGHRVRFGCVDDTGVYLFRMASGLLQIAGGVTDDIGSCSSATIADGMTAAIIILAMSFGLVVPKMVIDYVGDRSRRAEITGGAEHVNAR